MTFDPELAEIRFGCGLAPGKTPVASPEAMLAGVQGRDDMAARFEIAGFDSYRQRLVDNRAARKRSRKDPTNQKLKDEIRNLNRQAAQAAHRWYGMTVLRWAQTDTAFRERLVGFWANHFTARGKVSILVAAGASYIEDAIRPNLSGRFEDLLIATTTHPLMLHFLDQDQSIGPQSARARKQGGVLGLNENLAREVLELHTLGVGGPYEQHDVRQLAELFTGMTYSAQTGFEFRPGLAEPGPETVLGATYGGDPATLEAIRTALRDIARHPATADHIARKLAVHFVSDRPDPDLVRHVAARFRDTQGDLPSVYAALVEHPAAWSPSLSNVKPPIDYIATACRALGLDADRLGQLKLNQQRRALMIPLQVMGQRWQRPAGPDGWSEDDDDWITPQGVSARLRWALTVPQIIRPDLPDPRAFVDQALGHFATPTVAFAAASAETRAEAIGLILSAPAFQRR